MLLNTEKLDETDQVNEFCRIWRLEDWEIAQESDYA